MSFVLSAGQVERVHKMPTYSPIASRYVKLGEGNFQSYEHLWRTQPAVRTVVSFLARNIAQLGLHVFERRGDDDRKRVVDHPLAKLLERPFPGSPWTTYRLINWTIHELCIYDEAYWIKGKVGPDHALFPIPRRFIRPVGENPLFPDKFEIGGSVSTVTRNADEIVHFHGYNPLDLRAGTSPIETLRQVLAEEYASTEYREQLWRQGARVNGIITRPQKSSSWGDEAARRFKADWAEFTSRGAKAGGTPVLEDGMEYHPAAVTPKDAQYVESRKLTREECAVAYHVPPMMLGIMDGAGVAAAGEFHRILYQDCFGPTLAQVSQDIEMQLLPDLDPVGSFQGRIYVEFNLPEKLRGSFEAQAAALQAAVGGPYMTRSEARSRTNLPHLDEADELIVPLNVSEGGLASPQDTAPNNPSNAESNGKPPGPKPAELAT